ncbi:MAG TPA: esterase-like activity of phytase family protein, partial [Candidatus Limnocylindria bacterium]|nr:esterase-like activity of phytase family protein [Candidatus Limnocylindria bacterium]
NIRSAAADGTNNFWGAGGNSGTYYFGFDAAATTIQGSSANTRVLNILNGSLFFSSGAGTRGIFGFANPRLPATATATTNIITTGATSSPYAFSINTAGTVAYIADDSVPASNGGLQKWTNSGTAWVFSYLVNTTAVRGLVVEWSGVDPILYATTTTNSIISVTDTNAGSPATLLVQGITSTAFRGIAFTPQFVPTALGIATPPASLTVCERYPATFNVVATGDAPLSYQWRFNGGDIGGATSDSYTIAGVSTSNAGDYDVVVSNTSGSVTSAVATLTVQTTFAGFANKGLVGVGRVSANSFDLLGAGVDTLGGIFSAMFFDQASLAQNGDTYSGTLYALPDRGFGDGAQDYHPRVQTMSLSITPYYGSAPTNQTQIVFAPVATTLFTYGGTNFTGYDPDDLTITNFPQSSPGSLGQGKRSFDAEGIVRTADGGFFVSDEYGPMIARFDASGVLQYTLFPPEGLLPRRGPYPSANVFTGTNNPNSGRRSNRGFEGLTLMPDGKRLATALQSPAMQDGGANNPSRNTRLLIFDIDSASPTFGRAIAEYVYQLTLNGATATNRHTPLSELLAINNDQFLVLERDGIGLGVLPAATPIYKRVNVLSTRGATNIINTGYDLEVGAPGAAALPLGTLPAGISAAQRFDLVDIIDTNQLVKFGLNISTNQDQNTIGEKWEGLALIPLSDPSFPNDYLQRFQSNHRDSQRRRRGDE